MIRGRKTCGVTRPFLVIERASRKQILPPAFSLPADLSMQLPSFLQSLRPLQCAAIQSFETRSMEYTSLTEPQSHGVNPADSQARPSNNKPRPMDQSVKPSDNKPRPMDQSVKPSDNKPRPMDQSVNPPITNRAPHGGTSLRVREKGIPWIAASLALLAMTPSRKP